MTDCIAIEEFISNLNNLLETDSIEKQTDLTDLPEYDSLSSIKLALLIEDAFGFQISQEKLLNTTIVMKLYDYCLEMSSADG